jgi:hypothetical protein
MPAEAQQRTGDRPQAGAADRAATASDRGAGVGREAAARPSARRSSLRANVNDAESRFGADIEAGGAFERSSLRARDGDPQPAIDPKRTRKLRHDVDCRRPIGAKDRFRPRSLAFQSRCEARPAP